MKVAVFIGERFEGPVDHEIDAGDKLVAPGFIDTHVHSGDRATHRLISDIGRGDYFGQPFLEISVAREGARPGRTGNLLLQLACRFGELINIGTDLAYCTRWPVIATGTTVGLTWGAGAVYGSAP